MGDAKRGGKGPVIVGVILTAIVAGLLIVATNRPALTENPPPPSGYYVSVTVEGACDYGFRYVTGGVDACFEVQSFGLSSGPERMHLSVFSAPTLLDSDSTCSGDGIPIGYPYCSDTARFDSCHSEIRVIVILYDENDYPPVSPVQSMDIYPRC